MELFFQFFFLIWPHGITLHFASLLSLIDILQMNNLVQLLMDDSAQSLNSTLEHNNSIPSFPAAPSLHTVLTSVEKRKTKETETIRG